MENEKRYTLTVDLFVYANSDEDAKNKSAKFLEDSNFLIDNTDSQIAITSLHETPYAQVGGIRKVEI